MVIITFNKMHHQCKVEVVWKVKTNEMIHLLTVEFQQGFLPYNHKHFIHRLQKIETF